MFFARIFYPMIFYSPSSFSHFAPPPPPLHQAAIFVCIFYPMLGFASSVAHFFYFLTMILLSLMFYVAYGQVSVG